MTRIKFRAKVFNANVFPDGGRGIAVTLYKGLRRLGHYHFEDVGNPDEAVRCAIWQWLAEAKRFNRFNAEEHELLLRAREEHASDRRERLYMVGMVGRTSGTTWSDGVGADSVGATYHVRPEMKYKIILAGPWDASARAAAAEQVSKSEAGLWFDRASSNARLVGSYTVNVDYGTDIEDLVGNDGALRRANGISTSNFPPESGSRGLVDVKIDVFKFDVVRILEPGSGRTGWEDVGAVGAYRELRKLGYRPATVRELIALVTTHSGPELVDSIVAMGSRLEFWGNYEPEDNGYEFAHSFRAEGEKECLISLIGAGVDYIGLCRFAAVRQSESEIVVPEIPVSYLAA